MREPVGRVTLMFRCFVASVCMQETACVLLCEHTYMEVCVCGCVDMIT